MDVPLNCFKKVNTTSHLNILFGNNGCLSTVARIGAIMFSGANALAGNAFSMRSYRTRPKIARRGLVRLTTSTRQGDARPVTGTVVDCTGRESVRLVAAASIARVTNRKLRTAVSKAHILIKGAHLLAGFKVRCPSRLSSVISAVITYTVKAGCTNCLLLSSALGRSTIGTIGRLGTLGVGGVRVLSKSGRTVIAGFTRGLNVARTCKGLLPSKGIGRVRTLHDGPTGQVTFINSNVGSTPILTLDRINVTVNKLNDSTTVRATSMIVRASRPSEITATVRTNERARQVI